MSQGDTTGRRRFLQACGGIAAVGVTGLAGCTGNSNSGSDETTTAGTQSGDGTQQTQQTEQPLSTVVHGAVEGGTTGVLVEVMKEQGYDNEYGINVQPEFFTSPPQVQQQIVLSQDIPTGFMGSIVATRLNASGHNPKLVGPYMLYHMYVLTRSDSDINEPADLAGSRVSWASRQADAWLKFNVILEMDTGVQPDELEFVQTAPPASIDLLRQGELDAILLNEPLVTKALAENDFEVVFNPRQVWEESENLPLTTVDLAWDGNWSADNQESAVALAQASRDTQAYIEGNIESTIDTYTDAFGLENEAQISLAKERLTQIYPSEWDEQGFLDAGYNMAQRANEIGLIEEEPSEDIFSWVL
ncbi:ABC transporter substrate-binding protein [Halobacterium sp. R2-5]|uniref:ABC transporter substrate-binding protein n=1 Tax=Halobacterium sp. R2-5 TaxID=2715751 RepID=UPI0014219305|nr:ABC transporter substrate-binding protein [Halobacterium sp. R2-5]NIC00960.1 ABC transporter substrate-binding protein [Halobacterium sp. R2-5]